MVLPMYMGVILKIMQPLIKGIGAPHVYGGDPTRNNCVNAIAECSPCIWG